MKSPKLRIRKKVKITELRKFKQEVREIVHDCLLDIQNYIVDDVMRYLKKRGIIYAKKTTKKNKKKNKRKKKV